MLGRGILPRIGAYAVLALGFWLLFQAFERSNALIGIVGGALILAGMYLMTGAWRDTWNHFGGGPRVPEESNSSDQTWQDPTEENHAGESGESVAGDTLAGDSFDGDTFAGDSFDGDTFDGSDQSGQLPP